MHQIYVLKNNGEKEPFSEEKVLRSIKRVGLPDQMRHEVLAHVKSRLHPNITTYEIFSHITEFLEKKDKKASLRYNLKKALFDLGPTGFPFEKYMQRVFESHEYKATTDIILEGECVKHEIDILLEKNGEKSMVEVKFHNQPGNKTDIQVLLYTYARFLDVKDKNNISHVWVITNTKMSSDAIVYAQCKNIHLIAWDYPDTENLQDIVEQPEMYPITILSALSSQEKINLLQNNIVLTCELLQERDDILMHKYFINKHALKEAREQAQMVCNSKTSAA